MDNLNQDKQSSFFQKAYYHIASILFSTYFSYILLGIAMLLVVVARWHLLSFPLERDEGEYAYMGKLILDGHAPYSLAYNMKFPGTYYMYALIMAVFGKSITAIHTGLALISLISMVLIYAISRNFVSKTGSVFAAVSFGIMATSWVVLGQAAHATHFVTIFALYGTYLLLKLYEKGKHRFFNYFIVGLFFSIAFICKQSGLFFSMFGASVIIIREFKFSNLLRLFKHLIYFAFGFATPVMLMFSYFYFFGDFDKFWFWTVKYLMKYSDQVPLSEASAMFSLGVSKITGNFTSEGYIGLWIVALLGIILVFFDKSNIKNKLIVLSFFLFSALTIVPGFYFREHYFITLLPAVGLLVGVFFEFFHTLFLSYFNKSGLLIINFVVFALLISMGIKANSNYLFVQDNAESCKQIYGSNPFVESIGIADFLKQNTSKDDKIAVVGSEPQICFYADRYSATGYIYTYNLVEVHNYSLSMQQEMAKEIEINQPKYFVYIDVGTSWLCRPNSERYIFNWAHEFANKYYKLIGIQEIMPSSFSTLLVREHLKEFLPHSEEIIYIYERNK
jgi:Dolichyl-phosphate-mannose-protein mannosyltransferase